MTDAQAALDIIVEGIAKDIDEEDLGVAAGLLVMEAGRVAANYGIPREDIEQYSVEYLRPASTPGE